MNRHNHLFLCLVALLSASLYAQTTAPHNSGYIVHCGALIDGISNQPRKNVDVIVASGKITDIRAGLPEHFSSSPPEGRSYYIDLSTFTCLPGLIDTHTHVLLQGDIIVDYDEQLLKESSLSRDPGDSSRATGAGVWIYCPS